MSVEIATPPAIVFTESAAQRVFELIQEENDLSLKLRVYIEGGGCSGFQYGFTFDDCIGNDDTIVKRTIEKQPMHNSAEEGNSDIDDQITVELLVDSMSFQYLVGAEIDYVDDVEGERFIIRNPNAKTTCGCGSSFSV